MKSPVTIAIFCALLLFLSFTIKAQNPLPNPAPSPAVDDDFVCGLTRNDPVKLSVSVWNAKGKTFVTSLDYKDFEILEGKVKLNIEFFIRPNDETGNGYILGFTPIYDPSHSWHSLKIKLKSSKEMAGLVVVAPTGYFY